MPTLHLTGDADADALLSRDPLALLIGMALDQQIPMEKAFRGPLVLTERIGRGLQARDLAGRDDLEDVFAVPPAIHRFPGSMAGRVRELCRFLVEHHGGRAQDLWEGAVDGADLLARMTALPGFGEQKAQIFVALLGKQYGVQPRGWRTVAGRYGERDVHRSVADVTGPESLAAVRADKKAQKAAARERSAPA